METRKIGELLVAERIVQPQDVDKALALQEAAGGRLGAILFRTGAVSEEALLRVLSLQLGAPVLGVDAPMPDEGLVHAAMVESGIPLDWFIDQRVLLWRRGRFEEARAALESVMALPDDATPEFRRERANAYHQLGSVLYMTGDYESARDQ